MKVIDAFWILIVILFNLRFTLQMCGIETSFLTGIILLIIIAVILLNRIRRELLLIVPFFFLSFVNPASLTILCVFLLSYLSGFSNLKSIALKNAICSTFFVLLNFLLLSCGYINENYSDLSYKGQGVVSDYGYGNTNTFAIYVYVILLSYYISGFARNMLYWIVFLVVSYCVFAMVGSRTVLATEIFFVILCALQHNKWCSRLLYNRYILCAVPFLIFGFILFSVNLVKTSLVFDYSFTARFSRVLNVISQMSAYNYLIGYPKFLDDGMIDIAYCFLLFAGGVISVFYLVYCYIVFVKRISVRSYLLPVILSLLFLGISEAVIVNTYVLGGMFIWFILYKIVFSRLTISERNDTSINNYTCI